MGDNSLKGAQKPKSDPVVSRTPQLANTVVPESKFTQILHSKTFKDARPSQDQLGATEMPTSQSSVSGVGNVAKPGSALDRALRKHNNRNSGDPDPNANLTY